MHVSLSLSRALSSGAELVMKHGTSGEKLFEWQKCRLMGDILVLDDLMESDDSDR